MPKWLKVSLKIIGALIGVILIVFIALAVYVSYNKKKVLQLITETLNENINGTLAIGDIDPTLISGFPGISVSLKNVSLKDSLWQKHRHTLLQAGDVDVSVNALALLGGTVDINKITINNAAIDLFTDSTGYSNTAVFGKKKAIKEDQPKEESSSSAIIKKINFNKVSFTMDNRKAYKLFKFEVNSLKGKVNYPSTGWEADITLDTRVKSLAFNTKRGSFVKDKQLSGPFDIKYSNQTKVITVAPNKLNIGGDDFVIGARFDTGKDPVQFKIDIQVDELLWSHASALLAPNITVKLNMFNLAQPLWVHTVLNGDFGGGGDPAIDVNCRVRNTSLSGPGGKAENCSFDGVFTNHNVQGKGMNDENSAIKLYHFTGNYQQMPFTIDTAIIENLISPIASGNFKSNFGLTNLNAVTGGEPLKFTNGTASLNLKYKADIVDFQIHKPMLAGIISIKNADMTYVPRNLNLKNTSLSINFKGDDLLLNDIRLQSGRSVVMMNGKVSNFLNLYYNAPEKMLLTWYIRSPQMYLGEFLGVLNARTNTKRVRARKKNADFTEQLNTAFEKGNAEMYMLVDKVYYKKFLATAANAHIIMANNGLTLKNVSLKHAGGSLKINGNILQKGSYNSFALNSVVSNVDISHFFYAFDNFGLSSITSKNLRGFLSSKANVSGRITNGGSLVPKSVVGDVVINLKKGALLSFDPIKNVGKFAFPFRDLDNITFSNLDGHFGLKGEKITIYPMQINSSLLNLDLAGVYSLGKGTNLAIDVPLRNPKNDDEITDKAERQKRRMKGIVIHLSAVDGDDGKVKIKLGRNKKKDKDKEEEDKDKS